MRDLFLYSRASVGDYSRYVLRPLENKLAAPSGT